MTMLSYHDKVNMPTKHLVTYKLSLLNTLQEVNSELQFREMCGDTYFDDGTQGADYAASCVPVQ